MHNRSRSGNSNSCFVTALAFATVAVSFFCAPAGAQSSQAKTPAVPALKGGYVLTDVQICTTGKSQSQITGLATFNTTTGKLKLDGYIATGNPLTLTHLKQTLSYSNSTTTVTLGDTVYQVTYGKLEKGVATYLSLIAVADPCAAQIWLSRQ
jgi:hypothetical protein